MGVEAGAGGDFAGEVCGGWG
uniref:Uncharacterized protein n=1 Tax=Arundo donax TaxID=35708 RepID=A0A0A9HKK7_ARUDO